jgi:hypothetical protein
MGRRRPDPGRPRLRLSRYLRAEALPAPPAEVDYSGPAADFLARVLGNDQLGDCTAAGAFHAGAVLLANAGAPIPFSDQDVVAFYSSTTGYVPGDESTDNGGDEVTVLDYWRKVGLAPGQHQIEAWISVDAADANECRLAVWLFENLYFGVELPDAWLNPPPAASGFVWGAAAGDPDPNNGHCFVGVGYDGAGVKISTWGMIGTIAWDAVAKYASGNGQGELYAVLGPDAISRATGKAPNGFDFDQLQRDLRQLRGK